VDPVAYFLVPVFFVLMGMHTSLASFAEPGVAGLALGLCVVAIAGKLAAGLGARGEVKKLTVGLGMIPRGEVGLIFADIGARSTIAGEPVISGPVFSAVVAMVIVTTVVTPPLLKWNLGRKPAGGVELPRTP
jgi:Kef-type K+ transport system membrane component KefB